MKMRRSENPCSPERARLEVNPWRIRPQLGNPYGRGATAFLVDLGNSPDGKRVGYKEVSPFRRSGGTSPVAIRLTRRVPVGVHQCRGLGMARGCFRRTGTGSCRTEGRRW